jgi:sugar phosphate isomerase/epimerase
MGVRVGDKVLLSAGPENIEACVALALEHRLGIEMMAFAYPTQLDGDWQSLVKQYRTLLAPIEGELSMHGPFFDMSPGSIDRRIDALTTERYQQALTIAAELGVKLVVFHANFIGAIRNHDYRRGWQERSVAFWQRMGDYAARLNITIAVENMWEFDPTILSEVLERVNHPSIRACLDVGHAHLFSRVPFATWLDTLAPHIVHLHVNNNGGDMDIHQGLQNGVLDYPALLPLLRALPQKPTMTLEMDTVADMRASLNLLKIT